MRHLLLLCLLTAPAAALAETHYVSKTGSNTYPYTSWATATDSVRAAIDAADEWDTVLVGPGQFTADSLPLKKGLAFIGGGLDSTHIIHNGNDAYLVILADSCLVQGFHLSGIVDTLVSGTLDYFLSVGVVARADISAVVRNNRITAAEHAVYVVGTDQVSSFKRVIIEGNSLSSFEDGIFLWEASSVIRSNSFNVNDKGSGNAIHHLYGEEAVIESNRVYRDDLNIDALLVIEQANHITVRNNIFVSSMSARGASIIVNPGAPGFPTQGEISNNLTCGSEVGMLSRGGDITIRNNIITNTTGTGLRYDEAQTTVGGVRFNLFWNHAGEPVDTAQVVAFGGVFARPMFLDSLDFYLQAFSPAIDAGDTLLQDPDGTRSDIGPHGGPLGETYMYIDRAPKVPTGFSGQPASNRITLSWDGNHEADFDSYQLFRDTLPITTGAFQLLLAVIRGDSGYVDSTVVAGTPYYYRVRSVDKQFHISELSEELSLVPAGVGDDDPTLPAGFALRPNHPNPFNTATRITYDLAAPSDVTLAIYDVLGRYVMTLARDAQPAGEHSLQWDGRDRNGRPVASGVYLVRLSVGGEAQTRKVLLLK